MAEVAIVSVWSYECLTCGFETNDRNEARDHSADGTHIHDGRWHQDLNGAHLVSAR